MISCCPKQKMRRTGTETADDVCLAVQRTGRTALTEGMHRRRGNIGGRYIRCVVL